MIPCFNEVSTLPRCLSALTRQTLQPEEILVADGGSTDGSRELIREWSQQLPITLLDNPDQRQAPGLNRCIEASSGRFLARLDGHSFWNTVYLEHLIRVLERNPSLAAAGGRVMLDPRASEFQYDAWMAMCHRLGTGGPAYRKSLTRQTVESVQAPVYRREALRQCGLFREDMPWAEDDELHLRLRNQDWSLKLVPDARLYYTPRNRFRPFLQQFYNYGRGRGRMSALALYPSRRHRDIDRVLLLWTLGLCWNPIGWGLAVFYMFLPLLITLRSSFAGSIRLRLLYLFPGMHLAYWLGWTRERLPSLLQSGNAEGTPEPPRLDTPRNSGAV